MVLGHVSGSIIDEPDEPLSGLPPRRIVDVGVGRSRNHDFNLGVLFEVDGFPGSETPFS